MDKHTGDARHDEDRDDMEHSDSPQRSLDDDGGGDADSYTFDPRGGEDPGLLELTEDPRERRLKRNTM